VAVVLVLLEVPLRNGVIVAGAGLVAVTCVLLASLRRATPVPP
jgi:hypothetical protein